MSTIGSIAFCLAASFCLGKPSATLGSSISSTAMSVSAFSTMPT